MNIDLRSNEGDPVEREEEPAALDLSGWSRVHLIGMGGAGMSGIARLLLARGIAVSGSDLKDSHATQQLREAGARVFVGHRADQVDHADVVIVSSAIPADNPEIKQARGDDIPVLSRAQVLASLMSEGRSVAVAGTHGKTTTTSMISVMLSRLGLDPTYVIGGDLNEIGSGAWHGTGDVFVAEADESDGSFLLYSPEIAVITNVEEDHLDHYRDRADVERAFASFASRAGTVVACWDDPGVRRALADATVPVVRYGAERDGDVVIESLDLLAHGSRTEISVRGRPLVIVLPVPGRHNILNAAAAIGVAAALGLDLEQAAEALGSYTGVRRRFEHRGETDGAMFVDDYAHHPTEVVATLEVATNLRDLSADRHRIVAVFQPHRYTRTQAMWRALGESMEAADVVVFTDVYGAGERPIPGVTGKLLVDALTECCPAKRVVYLPRRSDVARFLASEIREGDLVLTLGAGDITMVAEETLERMREPWA
jgi:UDP-N-acetylmuramate--alanine ligase